MEDLSPKGQHPPHPSTPKRLPRLWEFSDTVHEGLASLQHMVAPLSRKTKTLVWLGMYKLCDGAANLIGDDLPNLSALLDLKDVMGL